TLLNGGTCWMKQGRVSKSDALVTKDQNKVCGILEEDSLKVNWSGRNWAMGCDFPGNDLANVRISGEKCSGDCANTLACTHFTWTTFNGGTCWKKQGHISANDAVLANITMVCGYMQ